MGNHGTFITNQKIYCERGIQKMTKIFLEDGEKVETILNAILTKSVEHAEEHEIKKGAIVTAFVYDGKTTMFSQVLGGEITKEFFTDEKLKREVYAKNKDLRDATEKISQLIKEIAFSKNLEKTETNEANTARAIREICFYDDPEGNKYNFWYFTAFAGSENADLNSHIANEGCRTGWGEMGFIKEPYGKSVFKYRVAGSCCC